MGRTLDHANGDPPLPFDFEEVPVTTEPGVTNALVMTPHQPMVFDRAWLERARTSSGLNPVDLGILDRVRRRSENTPIMMMRGVDLSGVALWQFDRNFTSAELEQAGRVFVGSLLPLYRGFLASGVVLFVHAQWGERETPPLRRGIEHLVTERDAGAQHPALLALDQWILKNMLLFSSLSILHVARTLLPGYVSLLGRRERRVRQLLDRVPEGMLDGRSPVWK